MKRKQNCVNTIQFSYDLYFIPMIALFIIQILLLGFAFFLVFGLLTVSKMSMFFNKIALPLRS